MNYDQPIETTDLQDNPQDLRPKKRRFSAKLIFKTTLKFIKKHRTFFILLAIAIVINFIIYLAVPVIEAGKTKFVNLGASVRIEMDQKVKLKFSNTSVVISNFSNEPCPEGKQCYGHGDKSVEYKLSINDVLYATGSSKEAIGSTYQVKTISSDYEKYSIIQIIESSPTK